jgi:hypothetical protein
MMNRKANENSLRESRKVPVFYFIIKRQEGLIIFSHIYCTESAESAINVYVQ